MIFDKDRYNFKNFIGLCRGQKLRYISNSVGSLPIIYGNSFIQNSGQLNIGDKLSIHSMPIPIFITVGKNGKLTIGNNVMLNYGVNIGCELNITIGNDVMIGDLSSIIDSNYHPVDSQSEVKNKEITIGDNVWIARMCNILPGVKVGKNSVIGAGSVITKDVPENVFVAGVPAKIIRKLEITSNWVRK
jgi:acetyltransferase-like isoleucine patch superfamily enzyme